ncbi:hypothetical protein RFI_20330 [Reticulomyxa filosa]|uniref:Uncharacterized protein n=1 Tax=Reticulomyxa filosa TaxID=46433 RepID=X6MSR2_RETFI|nr:hypothetical protein RFI_20330 [Reticulomyxa filosa]|eukprot:ETO17008.1 hypothetical protein RFI_20330 [Reticulomyxa filosa]
MKWNPWITEEKGQSNNKDNENEMDKSNMTIDSNECGKNSIADKELEHTNTIVANVHPYGESLIPSSSLQVLLHYLPWTNSDCNDDNALSSRLQMHDISMTYYCSASQTFMSRLSLALLRRFHHDKPSQQCDWICLQTYLQTFLSNLLQSASDTSNAKTKTMGVQPQTQNRQLFLEHLVAIVNNTTHVNNALQVFYNWYLEQFCLVPVQYHLLISTLIRFHVCRDDTQNQTDAKQDNNTSSSIGSDHNLRDNKNYDFIRQLFSFKGKQLSDEVYHLRPNDLFICYLFFFCNACNYVFWDLLLLQHLHSHTHHSHSSSSPSYLFDEVQVNHLMDDALEALQLQNWSVSNTIQVLHKFVHQTLEKSDIKFSFYLNENDFMFIIIYMLKRNNILKKSYIILQYHYNFKHILICSYLNGKNIYSCDIQNDKQLQLFNRHNCVNIIELSSLN